jgi:hypothetical protein
MYLILSYYLCEKLFVASADGSWKTVGSEKMIQSSMFMSEPKLSELTIDPLLAAKSPVF